MIKYDAFKQRKSIVVNCDKKIMKAIRVKFQLFYNGYSKDIYSSWSFKFQRGKEFMKHLKYGTKLKCDFIWLKKTYMLITPDEKMWAL